jgi:hypothetical protein
MIGKENMAIVGAELRTCPCILGPDPFFQVIRLDLVDVAPALVLTGLERSHDCDVWCDGSVWSRVYWGIGKTYPSG